MATADQIKIRVDKFKTVAEVDIEIEKFTRQQSLAGNYNKPDSQAYVAALKIRKIQLSEQSSSGFKPYVPPPPKKVVADDNKANPAIPKKKNNTNSGPHPRNSTAPAVATPTTQAGETGTLAAKFGKPKPGKRLQNPLGNFSSYTYQISLYMITPDAYNAFVQSGRTNINAINNITSAGLETIDNANRNSSGFKPYVPPSQANIQDNNLTQKSKLNKNSSGFKAYVPPNQRDKTTSPPAASSTLSNTVNKGGAYLIAQSGGINNNSDQRAPGFDTDFYIDDLKLSSKLAPAETQSTTVVTDITFKIIEQYGFSFISRLRRAQDALASNSSSLKYGQLSNPLKNMFILGIKFLGYDENGELIDPNKYASTLGNPVGNAHGIYERFLDILVTSVKYKIDGRPVTYQIEANQASIQEALGMKNGIVWTGASVSGGTVRDALMGKTQQLEGGRTVAVRGLMSKLNSDQQELLKKKKIEIATQYTVEFIGDSEKIANATLISTADLDKRFWPQSNAKTTSQVTIAKEQKEKSKPINTARQISLGKGIPIVQAINEIIKQSSFLENALTAIVKTQLEPEKNTITGVEIPNSDTTPPVIEWYNIQPEIENLGWDNIQRDFVYKITYKIQTYSTPFVLSAYTGLTEPYYGPDKRYDYWFTGKNTEVLKFEAQFDTNFYMVTYEGAPEYSTGTVDIPVKTGQPQNQSKTGKLNTGQESQNSYLTSLYDPATWANAKIQILGDPDFLINPSTNNLNSLYDKFYGPDGYTLNPNGRQVFVELNFVEPMDYDNSSGTLSMNESIYFFQYPSIIKKDLDTRGGGVIFQVLSVNSTFSKGKFEQELECNLAVFTEKTADVKAEKEAARPAAASAAAASAAAASINAQAAARIKRQGAPTSINAQAAARIKRQGFKPSLEAASKRGAGDYLTPQQQMAAGVSTQKLMGTRKYPWEASKQNQTTTIPTKNGQVVQDDNAGVNPRQRR
jgi:hypothetical protein